LHAVAQDSTFHDEFRFSMQTSNSDHTIFNTDLHYSAQSGVNKTEMHFQFQLYQIVEFPSSNPNIIYDITSKAISTWPSPNQHQKWTDWSGETEIIDGVILRKWTKSDGVVTVRCSIAEAIIKNANMNVGPNHVKIDIEIHNYPYQQPNGTRLGLYSTVQSKTKVRSHDKGQHNFIFNDETGLPSGMLAWVPEISIDNTSATAPVVALSYQDNANWEIYYTFVTPQDQIHPADIVWDPSVGLDYNTPPAGICVGTICGAYAYVLIAGIAVVILIVAGIIAAVIYRRKRTGYTLINE